MGHDGLTGCLTYESTIHELTREINRSERGGSRLSCCFVDLDEFKLVNDRHGHVRGNQVLTAAAGILRDGVRNCDVVGRYGGDEFVVILPQTSETKARRLAERLRSLIADAEIPSADEPMTASVGVAEWTPGTTPEQLLTRADGALLAAKARGTGVLTDTEASTASAVTDAVPGTIARIGEAMTWPGRAMLRWRLRPQR